jgi:general secretion pathway protein I
MNNIPHHQAGFSLLEILVAFSVLALSLGVLYQIFSQGTRTAILTEEYTQAMIIAQSRLATIGMEHKILPGTEQGTERDDYHWSTTIHPYTEAPPSNFQTGASVYEVAVIVSWESFGKTHEVELQSLKLFLDK